MRFLFQSVQDPELIYTVEFSATREGKPFDPPHESLNKEGAVRAVINVPTGMTTAMLHAACQSHWLKAPPEGGEETVKCSIVAIDPGCLGGFQVFPDLTQPEQPSAEVVVAIEGTAERWGNDIAQAIAEDREIEPDPVTEEAAKSAKKKG